MNCSTPGLPVHHQLPESTQSHVHRVGDAIQPSHHLSSPSPPSFNLSQHQGLFQWLSSLHQWEEKSDGKRFTRELWKPNERSLARDHPAVPQRTRYQYSLIIWEMNLEPKQEHFRAKNILIISLPLFTCWILRKYLQKLNHLVASVYFVAVECLMHVKSYSVVFLEKYSYCW